MATAQAATERQSAYTASQWTLMWHAFKKHRLAAAGGALLILAYIVVLFGEFIAPYDPNFRDQKSSFVPPMRIHIVTNGALHRPSIYALKQIRDMETLRLTYVENPEELRPIRFFVRSDPYELWGLIESDVHLFGVEGNQRMYLFGTDQMGRDMLSRMIYGARISMSIGLIGVSISFVLAIVLGCLSGYFGGAADTIIQRIIEILRSIPTLPLWMALAIAIPLNWPITRVFFAITIILSLLSWPGLAREVRGKILALRGTDYVVAAMLDNAGTGRLLSRYLLPSIMSHLIASITLAIPGMILGETALSYLGLGLRAPAISWGVLLQNAQNTQTVVSSPWLLLPVLPIIIVILSFNFLGDGLRDAADPYKST